MGLAASGLGWVWLVFVAIALAAAPASALPLIQTDVYAEAIESGEDPGSDEDEDSTTTPGQSIEANAFRCPGLADCVVPPSATPGGFARAETDYGVNRAYARAPEGYDENQENDITEGGYASSFWADDWTFIVPPGAAGDPVSLEFAIDGSWANGGGAKFSAAIFDPSEPYFRNPDDPIPFLDIDAQAIAALDFESNSETAFLFQLIPANPFQIIPIDDGGEPSGSVDLEFVLQFIPVAGRTYIVAARLVAGAGGEDDQSSADFGSTAQLVRVVVPEGVSFASAAGADWNVEVPEAGSGALVGLALAAGLALRRRAP